MAAAGMSSDEEFFQLRRGRRKFARKGRITTSSEESSDRTTNEDPSRSEPGDDQQSLPPQQVHRRVQLDFSDEEIGNDAGARSSVYDPSGLEPEDDQMPLPPQHIHRRVQLESSDEEIGDRASARRPVYLGYQWLAGKRAIQVTEDFAAVHEDFDESYTFTELWNMESENEFQALLYTRGANNTRTATGYTLKKDANLRKDEIPHAVLLSVQVIQQRIRGNPLGVITKEPSARKEESLEKRCVPFTWPTGHANEIGANHAKETGAEDQKRPERTQSQSSARLWQSADTRTIDLVSLIVVKPIQANVHSPIYRQQIYKGFIKENAPAGTPVVTESNTPLIVAATDKDSGPNALVAYRSLNKDDPFFVVDLVSGAIRSRKPLDFEKMTEWSFYVKASDMGQPPRSSVPVPVQIAVVDENDVSPKFSQPIYKEKDILLTVTGFVVARPTADDVDTNGKLRYFLKNREMVHLFAVNATTGELSVAAENSSSFTETSYKLDVMVTDGVHTASSVVQLGVMPAKKTGFRCAQAEYAVTVVENNTFSGSRFLTALTALGAKEGSTVVYSLLSPDDRFIVNQGTGSVYLAGQPFDREEKPAKTVNKPVQTAHCVLVVNLEDVNDCSPQFVVEPYETVVSVDAKMGEKLFSIKVIDRDSGSNGMMHYSSADIPKQFKLNKHDGKVTVAAALESEEIYQFTVEATDRGTPPLKSSTVVKVSVAEKARPLFSSNSYEAQLAKTAVVDTLVSTVKAVSNTNGVLVYSLDDRSGLFRIDADSGNLYLRRPVESNSNHSTVAMKVTAEDVTRKGMSATVAVNVKIVGGKDRAPVFSESLYKTNFTESTPVGSILRTLKASDSDDGDHVIYSATGSGSEVVKVDMESGVVSLAQQLDFEKQQRYDIKIKATDSVQLAGEAILSMQVLDINDEPPRFAQPFAVADVADTALPGQFITILSVSDEDTVASLPSGHGVLYSVIDGDDSMFNVDSQTGEAKPHLLVRRVDYSGAKSVKFDFNRGKPFFQLRRTNAHLKLSAVRFFNITLKTKFKERIDDETSIEIVKSLRLKCHWLSISVAHPSHIQIFPLISFKNFCHEYFDSPSSLIQTWPLWNCDELFLGTMRNTDSLADTIFNAKKVSFDFTGPQLPHDAPFEPLVNCLTDFRRDRRKRRSLEYMHVTGDFYFVPVEVEGWILLWRGYCRDYDDWMGPEQMEVFDKVPIDGGFAIIQRSFYECQVFIVPDDKRETWLNLTLPHIFKKVPFDLSAVYDDFLTADTDEMAFKLFVGEYYSK